MKVIGFTTKYYTLWEVNEEIITNERGKYKVINHVYIKNISFDLNKAKEKYPTATIDTALRGHTSWGSTECIERYGLDKFQSGKYRGEKIEDCTDYQYLVWAFNLDYIIDYDSQPLVISILEKAGYKKINDYHIATPEELDKIEASFSETEDAMRILDETGYITLTTPKNLDEEGTVKIGNIELIWKDTNWKYMNYNGWPYGLPINSKGQAKRIKGKEIKVIPEKYEIEVNEYGWGATLIITVKDFEIIK